MARFASALLLLAAALPFTLATNCNQNEFFWEQKSCCLPTGGHPNPPSPPSGTSCPTNGWQWHNEKSCCVPTHPQTPQTPPPQCKPDCSWDKGNSKCTPNVPRGPPTTPTMPSPPPPPSQSSDCKDGTFFFGQAKCCLPHGTPANPPSPPSGVSCPQTWYWHGDKSHCVPSAPQTPTSPPPQCQPSCKWNPGDLKCYPTPTPSPPPSPPSTPTQPSSPPKGPSDCDSNHFWFPKIGCCPQGGPSTPPPSPPPDTSCPVNGWYWHHDSQHCAPNHPQPPSSPPPQCKPGCGWNPDELKCHPQPPSPPSNPPPKPSGYHKRHLKSRAVTLCPLGFEACPIQGLMTSSGDYECLDTTAELTSCGGCASTGAGEDCTAIKGVWNVACNAGKCKIGSCASGYKLAIDGKSCIKL